MKHPLYLGTSTPLPGCDAGSLEELEPDRMENIAYLVLDGSPDEARENLDKIRRNTAPAIYLKPIARIGRPDDPLAQAVDVCVEREKMDFTHVESLVERFQVVNQWIEGLADKDSEVDVDPAFRILRFIASRGTEVIPIMNVASPKGFVFPSLTPLVDSDRQETSIVDILAFLESQQLIQGRFITRTFFCNHCDCAFLSFKESCPDCGSENIEAEELVHHFRCGYVGAHADYRTAKGLFCPKCERELHQLGVDYDKPSVVYHCHECNHRFQSPTVMTTCFRCERSAEPEQQVQRRIMAMKHTAMGNTAAIYGMEKLFMRVIDTSLGLWSFEALKRFVEVEAARIERYGRSESSIVVLHFTNLSDLYIQLGQQAERIFNELAQVLKSVLRKSDLIAASGESTFVLVLTETTPSHAEIAIERIEHGITELMESNLSHEPEFLSQAWTLAPEVDVDALIETLISDHD